MRWKKLKVGDTRIKNKFCLLPTTINGIVYWLERIKILQKYTYRRYEDTYGDLYGYEVVERYEWINEKVLEDEKEPRRSLDH